MKTLTTLSTTLTLLAAVLACNTAGAASNTQISAVPIKAQVTHGSSTLLDLDAVILGYASFKFTQPGYEVVNEKSSPKKPSVNRSEASVKLRLEILETTRREVSMRVLLDDSTDLLSTGVNDLVSGKFATDSVFSLERGKPFNFGYQLCKDERHPACKASLNLTVE